MHLKHLQSLKDSPAVLLGRIKMALLPEIGFTLNNGEVGIFNPVKKLYSSATLADTSITRRKRKDFESLSQSRNFRSNYFHTLSHFNEPNALTVLDENYIFSQQFYSDDTNLISHDFNPRPLKRNCLTLRDVNNN